MEGLVNYGSDDELESPINAAERRSSNHPNKKYKSIRRSRSASSSNSSVNAKTEGNGGYRRHNEKDTLRSKESERSSRKTKRDSREYVADHKQMRDRDRKTHERHYRNTRDADRERHDRNERYYDNKSHSKDTKNEKDYACYKQDRRKHDYPEEKSQHERKETDRHRRRRELDSRVNQHEHSNSHTRKDSRRSKSPSTSERKRRYAKSRSQSPAQKNKSYKVHKQLRDNGRNVKLRHDVEKATVEEKTVNTDGNRNALIKEPATNKVETNQPQLPKYYNPSVVNPNKYVEQVQKRKLLWGNKKAEDNASKWGTAQFSEDSDGKVASKFMRLMGIKNSSNTTEQTATTTDVKSREAMFSSMEQQYEVARQATHTMRGVGLGFSSQSRLI